MKYIWVVVLLILFAVSGCGEEYWEKTWDIVEKEIVKQNGGVLGGDVSYHIVGIRDGRRELIPTWFWWEEKIYYACEVGDKLTIRFVKYWYGKKGIESWWTE